MSIEIKQKGFIVTRTTIKKVRNVRQYNILAENEEQVYEKINKEMDDCKNTRNNYDEGEVAHILEIDTTYDVKEIA